MILRHLADNQFVGCIQVKRVHLSNLTVKLSLLPSQLLLYIRNNRRQNRLYLLKNFPITLFQVGEGDLQGETFNGFICQRKVAVFLIGLIVSIIIGPLRCLSTQKHRLELVSLARQLVLNVTEDKDGLEE